MYASIVAESSFWSQLVEIDRQLQQATIARGCPWCGGALHVGDHPRKPRGIPEGLEDVWSRRFNTCCGRCRRRSMPPSVRFLGRRVYVGAVVILATMFALVCEAARRTLGRWTAWWTQALPATTWWRQMRGRFDRPVDGSRLPASLLERYEAPGCESAEALISMLTALGPMTTSMVASTVLGGAVGRAGLAQKMPIDCNRRDLLPESRAPTRTT